jgi:hypothetical protein
MSVDIKFSIIAMMKREDIPKIFIKKEEDIARGVDNPHFNSHFFFVCYF